MRVGAVQLALLAVTGLGACSGGDPELSIDVRTDLSPGVEFTVARAQLDGEVSHLVSRRASTTEDWGTGVRVADFGTVATGDHTVKVTLITGFDLVVEREVLVTVTTSRVISVLLTRGCIGRACPASACSARGCVDPRCSADAPERCGDASCARDADCTPASTCAVARCLEHACVTVPRPTSCPTGMYCSTETGCETLGDMDGGTVDASAPDLDATSSLDGGDGEAPTDAGPSGLCTNAVDTAAIIASYDGGTVDDLAAACARGCFTPPLDECVTQCLVDRTHRLSGQCASCWGTAAKCSADNCLVACALDPGSDACHRCQCGENRFMIDCRAALARCTGFPSMCAP